MHPACLPRRCHSAHPCSRRNRTGTDAAADVIDLDRTRLFVQTGADDASHCYPFCARHVARLVSCVHFECWPCPPTRLHSGERRSNLMLCCPDYVVRHPGLRPSAPLAPWLLLRVALLHRLSGQCLAVPAGLARWFGRCALCGGAFPMSRRTPMVSSHRMITAVVAGQTA